MATLTSITLTYNEQQNIAECIASIKEIVDRIVILDGGSTDQTRAIAESLGAEVYQKECGYYERFQYGMKVLKYTTDWILFIDADERLTSQSRAELQEMCETYKETETNGIVVNYRVEFMGKELRYGGSVLHKLRVFKPGTAYMEKIALDQHIRLFKGNMAYMKSFLLHKDDKGVLEWSKKHVTYADKASIDYLKKIKKEEKIQLSGLEKGAKWKRILKYKVYYRLPGGVRARIFYIYRYYLRFGFLDGREGKIYTYLHAYWYRFLVDTVIYEKTKENGTL